MLSKQGAIFSALFVIMLLLVSTALAFAQSDVIYLPLMQGNEQASDLEDPAQQEEAVPPDDETPEPASTSSEASSDVQSTSSVSVWTHVAAACVPDEYSLAKYEASAARFRHKGTNTGDIYARCNITNPKDDGSNTTWNTLEVVYLDPSGDPPGTPPDPTQVKVELVRVNNLNGGVTTHATFDSNSNMFPASANAQIHSVSFDHTFNFEANAYYIYITVSRTSAVSTPEIYIVRLKQGFF